MSQFAVVGFEDQSVSLVPANWLMNSNKYCAWPNSDHRKFQKKMVTPQPDWRIYKVIKINYWEG